MDDVGRGGPQARARGALAALVTVVGMVGVLVGTQAAPAAAAPGDVDLGLSQSLTANEAVVGGTFTIRVTATNRGAMPATNVVVTDSVPSALTITSATHRITGGQDVPCQVVGQDVSCHLGTLAATSGTGRLTIVTTANAVGPLSNTAVVTSDGDEPSPDPHPNSVTATSEVRESYVDLLFDTDVEPSGQWHVGRSRLMNVAIVNAGTTRATNATLRWAVPDQFRINYAFIPGSTGIPTYCPVIGQVITCGGYTFGPGDGVPIRVGLTPRAAVASVDHVITLDSDQAEVDPDPHPNVITYTASVSDRVDLRLEGAADHPGPDPVLGVPFTYRWSVGNAGAAFATTATVVQQVPPGSTIDEVRFSRDLPGVSNDLEGTCEVGGQTVTCTPSVPGILPDDLIEPTGSPWVLEVRVTPTALGASSSTATITSAQPEPVPDPFPNTATVDVEVVAADRASTVTGSVSTPSGIEGTVVRAYRSSDGFAPTASTPPLGGAGDTSAAFAFAALPPGTYAFLFTPPASSGAGPQWSGGSATRSGAATLTVVGDGAPLTLPDEELEAAARFRGTVRGTGGAVVPGARVALFAEGDGWLPAAVATTAADGSYDISGVAPGAYRMRIVAPPGSGLVSQWWSGSPNRAGAAVITAPAGADYRGVDADLAAGASLSGLVRDATGQGLGGVRVVAYLPGDTWVGSYETTTAGDGTYSLPDIPSGTVQVRFVAPAGSGLAPRWYDGATTRASATSILVTGSIAGIDLSWAPPAT